ncbi:MAG: lipoate--protein ligase family protein, partial [Alphaproteobacteria bacterium]|nr:lipoate--protein ligase family protein [Alphaproteobacteria bacterium]
RIPDTIRFLSFVPTALVGRHQDLSREIRLDYCAAHGIGLARRITGGGALYMDEGQFGFELVFHRRTLGLSSLSDIAQALCEAVAAGVSTLGVHARFRPRNDIEVDGRKISGTGGFFDGDTIIYQGTVLVEMEAAKMLAALNVPKEKLEKRALDSAASRVVTLAELLGAPPALDAVKAALLAGFHEHLGIAAEWGAIGEEEEALARQFHDEEIGTDEFLRSIDNPAAEGVFTGTHTGAGGTVRAHVRLEGPRSDRLREVLITGDFFVTPPRVVLDLEAALRGTQVSGLRQAVAAFFARANVGLLSVKPEDFAAAIEAAVAVPA